jgi:hypothetical protein
VLLSWILWEGALWISSGLNANQLHASSLALRKLHGGDGSINIVMIAWSEAYFTGSGTIQMEIFAAEKGKGDASSVFSF